MTDAFDTKLAEAMDTFFAHYAQSHDQLETIHDSQWPSSCEVGHPYLTKHGTMIGWRPILRQPQAEHPNDDLFQGLENALELTIHPTIKTHYSRYWSGHLEAQAPQGPVSLIYLWNEEDAQRLIENLIGHAVACRQNRVPFSAFFACTDLDSDYYLTVNNDTGQVQLETPGKRPIRTVCDSLDQFYQWLVPANPQQLERAQRLLTDQA